MNTKNNIPSSLRRKDYITLLAVWLFVFIIIFEILLVTVLPRMLLKRELWDKEVAHEEMNDLMDILRWRIRKGIKYKTKMDAGEAHMSLDALDDIAKYLRQYQDDLTRSQIRDIYMVLRKIEVRMNLWRKNKYVVKSENIDISPLLKTLQEQYKNYEQDKQKQTKTNSNIIQK